MMFAEQLKSELNKTTQLTENGAIGYSTSGSALLDLNFGIASFRSEDEDEILSKFLRAYYEDKQLAAAFLFFARDVRGGLGERRFFRVCFKWLCNNDCEVALNLMGFIKEYGRWDDILCIFDTTIQMAAISIIKKQLSEDIAGAAADMPISLLAKWLPSANTSSGETKRLARILYTALNWNERGYRKVLTSLRKHIDIVETRMSAKQWDKIDYSAVPSVANIKYNSAFLRNDEDRRREYLESLKKGDTKINAGVLYPHDIVHKYCADTFYWSPVNKYDETLEQLWKALPNLVNEDESTIVVADGSGSMTMPIGDTKVASLDVANALAIYFAERCSGQFKDKYITFSMKPQFVDLSKCHSLRDKLINAREHNEMANTNIEAVFDIILSTALSNHLSQSELPKNILIISDMEFDMCACSWARDTSSVGCEKIDKALMEVISQRYESAGYKLPRLIFWNVNSRTKIIPVQENSCGVALVSGFSINICKMVLSNKLDPLECLLEQLNSERYQPIIDALKFIV